MFAEGDLTIVSSNSESFAYALEGKFDGQAYFGLVELKLTASSILIQSWGEVEVGRLRRTMARQIVLCSCIFVGPQSWWLAIVLVSN